MEIKTVGHIPSTLYLWRPASRVFQSPVSADPSSSWRGHTANLHGRLGKCPSTRSASPSLDASWTCTSFLYKGTQSHCEILPASIPSWIGIKWSKGYLYVSQSCCQVGVLQRTWAEECDRQDAELTKQAPVHGFWRDTEQQPLPEDGVPSMTPASSLQKLWGPLKQRQDHNNTFWSTQENTAFKLSLT